MRVETNAGLEAPNIALNLCLCLQAAIKKAYYVRARKVDFVSYLVQQSSYRAIVRGNGCVSSIYYLPCNIRWLSLCLLDTCACVSMTLFKTKPLRDEYVPKPLILVKSLSQQKRQIY